MPYITHRITAAQLACVLAAACLLPLSAAHAQQDTEADRTVMLVEIQAQPAVQPPILALVPVPVPAPLPGVTDDPGVLIPVAGSDAWIARPVRQIHIGRATERLLDMQRAEPGQYARPIDGEAARRSYARYLKSFETEIPVHFKTGIDTGLKN